MNTCQVTEMEVPLMPVLKEVDGLVERYLTSSQVLLVSKIIYILCVCGGGGWGGGGGGGGGSGWCGVGVGGWGLGLDGCKG